MAITGGIKFFQKSKSLGSDGTTIVAGTGNASSPYAIDRNPFTVWRSVGSDDMTTETITVTLPAPVSISRLFLIGHNFKDFNVQYDSAGFTHFASVVGLDGSKSNITETAFADSTAYYEFTPVTTDEIRIQVLKSQVVDAQKYLNQIILTNELGTLSGFPVISEVVFSRSQRVSDMTSGRKNVQKSIETFGFSMDLQPYPSSYTADLNLLFSLVSMEDPFLTWLCGGRRGSTYFGHTLPGFRIGDVFPMQLVSEVASNYMGNLYKGPVESSFTFYEVTT